MKLRNIRGPNCVDARVSVTIVIEKTMPTTVMTAAASVVRIWRAASAVPKTIHDGSDSSPLNCARSSTCVPMYSTTATTTSIVGTSHRFVRSASRRHSERRVRREITVGESRSTTRTQGPTRADQASRLTRPESYPLQHATRSGTASRTVVPGRVTLSGAQIRRRPGTMSAGGPGRGRDGRAARSLRSASISATMS